MSRLALALCLLAGCTRAPTEILVEVRSDLLVPDELDRLQVDVRAPDGRTQTASADLGPGQVPLPRTVGLVHTTGELGVYAVTVRGQLGRADVVARNAAVTFQAGRTLVLRVDLLRECVGVDCTTGQTCAAGGCARVADVSPLTAYDGRPPPLDAAAFDTCVPTERCNRLDDDCDGRIDEGFDLDSDPLHCGMCGNACAVAHTVTSCVSGRCVVDSCEAPFDDCDRSATNGCETDTNTSAMDCGTCENRCAPPTRNCCSGTCCM